MSPQKKDHEESRVEERAEGAEEEVEGAEKKKRVMGKQPAFVEFKRDDGKELESNVIQSRKEIGEKRA